MSFKDHFIIKHPINKQDLLKFFAIIIMLIDHLGCFFYQDQLWLRAIGRASFPIWFFFVGYNFNVNKFTLFNKLFLCAIALLIFKYFFTGEIIQLNVLFTIIIYKSILYLLSKTNYLNEINKTNWFICSIMMLCFFPFTAMIFDYGTIGVILTLFGYMKKKKLALKEVRNNKISTQEAKIHPFYAVVSFLAVFISQIISFKIDLVNFILFFVFLASTIYYLSQYQECNEKKLIFLGGHNRISYIIRLFSHYSLEFYSLHLIIFIYIQSLLQS